MLFWWIFLLPALVADGRTLLRSAPQMCPIDNDNLLEVKLFVTDGNQCYNLCEENPDCEFFRLGNLFTLMYVYAYIGMMVFRSDASHILGSVKSRAIDRSTIQFWNFLDKGHST